MAPKFVLLKAPILQVKMYVHGVGIAWAGFGWDLLILTA